MIKVRPGVILTHVCGQSLLVAAYEARQYCPYITILNETGESIWKCLKKEMDVSEIAHHISKVYDIPSDINVEKLITDYINQLHKSGYII